MKNAQSLVKILWFSIKKLYKKSSSQEESIKSIKEINKLFFKSNSSSIINEFNRYQLYFKEEMPFMNDHDKQIYIHYEYWFRWCI